MSFQKGVNPVKQLLYKRNSSLREKFNYSVIYCGYSVGSQVGARIVRCTSPQKEIFPFDLKTLIREILPYFRLLPICVNYVLKLPNL